MYMVYLPLQYNVFEMTEEQSAIERILRHNFEHSPHSQDFNKTVSKDVLKLVVVDRIDKNIAYVTDGVHTILTIMANKTEMFTYYALSRHPNQHYTYEPKSYAYLTFNTITPAPPDDAKHPYTPHHFLKEHYENFVTFKSTYKIKAPAQRIVILEWNLALVNINSSGYYAPVIAIRKFKKEQTPQPPSYLALNCVLYEKWLQEMMEYYRIEDIRRIKKEQHPVTQNISMFYFMRNMKKSNSMSKNSSLVTMDYEERVVKHDKSLKMHFILVGHLKGTISFANAHKSEINEARIEEMNIKNIAMLFNGLSMKELEQKERETRQKPILWSDSDSSDDDDDESNERGPTQMYGQDDSDSDEAEDPLKNLYVKSLQSKCKKAV